MHLIFIYDAFRTGQRRHFELGGCRCLNKDETQPTFTMLNMHPVNVPLVLPKGNTSIKGEVYAVTEEMYKYLCQANNVPLFAVPKIIKTKRGMICVIFVASPNIILNSKNFLKTYPKINSGEWKCE